MSRAKHPTLTTFELHVIEYLLEGDHWIITHLREQMPYLEVKSRDHSPAGFYTNFSLNPDFQLRFYGSFEIGDITIEVPSLIHGVGTVLFVRQGVISMLEGYTVAEDICPKCFVSYRLVRWPQETDRHTLMSKLSRFD